MQIVDLLRKNNKLTKEIKNINFHFNLLTCDLEYFKMKIPALRDKSNEEIANFVVEVFNKCDSSKEEYDYKLDEEMTRIGLRTDVFNGRYTHNKWDEELFEDDNFGFGQEITSIYDDYIDSEGKGTR